MDGRGGGWADASPSAASAPEAESKPDSRRHPSLAGWMHLSIRSGNEGGADEETRRAAAAAVAAQGKETPWWRWCGPRGRAKPTRFRHGGNGWRVVAEAGLGIQERATPLKRSRRWGRRRLLIPAESDFLCTSDNRFLPLPVVCLDSLL